MNCGRKSSPYYRPANRIPWGVIVLALTIGKRWMRFSIACGQDVSGKPWMTPEFVQAVALTGAFRSGHKQAFFRCYGHKVCLATTNSGNRLAMASHERSDDEGSSWGGKDRAEPN